MAGAASAAGLAYISHRGLRYPRMTLSPLEPSNAIDHAFVKLLLDGVIETSQERLFRAIQPEPKISATLLKQEFEFKLNNVAPSANLVVQAHGAFGAAFSVDETVDGITRTVRVKGPTQEKFDLHWQLPQDQEYQFSVIGDSGGGDELRWCLKRAHELGAQFMLHLGDFNYAADEYDQAIDAFYNAALPSYITLGNHDFNDSGLVFHRFLEDLGRFNHAFNLVGTQFLNIDTAASFFPLSGGQRGRFMNSLSPSNAPKVAFSHRPFVDIRPGEDHALSSEAETQWLLEKLHYIKCQHYLCGHVHKSGESDVSGIRQWTVGEGLGYEDWVARAPVSRLLLGTVAPESEPTFKFAPLQMPWEYHTSHEHLEKLLVEQPQEVIDWYLKKVNDLDIQA